uniref:RING-type E3 ubiquitin transferase n=1 Tax=Suricata suricatta TaxID=37032 RepID=A0A673VBQ4_SURSU
MENTDSDGEDGSAALRQRQMDRSVREENFYEFVNNLSEEDYKLMRDNDLLGIPGESTVEELLKRLQQIKENSPAYSEENAGGEESSNKSGEYLLDCLNPFGQTEDVTSGQRENQSWEETSQINSDGNDSTFSLPVNSNPNNGSPNPENEYVASTRYYRAYNTENSQNPAENIQSESTFIGSPGSEQSTTEALIHGPVTRGQRRARSRRPNHRRTRAGTASPAPNRTNEQRFHYSLRDQILQPLVNETENFPRIPHQETSRQQITGLELQNRGLAAASGTSGALHKESSPGTTNDGESCRLGEINPTIPPNPELGQVCPRAHSQRDSIATRIQLTCEIPNDTVSLESEQGGVGNIFPHSENARIPSRHILLTTGFNDIPCPPIQSTLRQTVTGSSDLSDSDLSENASNAMTPSDCNSNPSSDFYSTSTLISSSDSNYMSNFNSTSMPSSSSRDEDSEINSVIFEGSNNISLSPGSLSETRQENRSLSPITFDYGDSWDQFYPVFYNSDDQWTGLPKAQIDNLAIRSFGEGDALQSCAICITEYTEGNKVHILPCTHEFHVDCVDRWLSENSTCPICHTEVAYSAQRQNSD